MFCPKCGQRNEGNDKFCRGCGENLNVIAKAMERRRPKLLYSLLDGYIRYQNRKLPDAAKAFRNSRWIWLMIIGISLTKGLFGLSKDWWLTAAFLLPALIAGFWDYVSFRRLSTSGSSDRGGSAQAASSPGSVAELSPAPTTNELTPPLSVTESTTRRLEPLIAEKRSGELL